MKTTLKIDPSKPHTIGELYGPAMEITDAHEAKEYFAELVSYCVSKWNKSINEAASIVRQNLGYYAGYYDDATRQRVEKLFECSHPVFGAIEDKPTPSADEAFAMGVTLAGARK